MLPQENLSVQEIVDRMIERDEKNYEIARFYEYDQETITEKLGENGEVIQSKAKTSKQRLQRYLSYKVQGMKQGKEVETEVGFGDSRTDAPPAEGSYLEAMTMRELSHYYDFQREKDDAVNGTLCYLLSFKPKDWKQVPKAKSREEKVLANLSGKFWIHPEDFSIVMSDSRLASPLPFAIIDLVSLRSLHIHYEAVKFDDTVWLPREMEVSYQVRILYFSTVRERQKTRMANFEYSSR